MNLDFEIAKDPGISEILEVGVLYFQELQCQKQNGLLWDNINALGKQYQEQYENPSQALQLLKPARDLYRSIGIEPTRHRPSSEALLRRIIKGKPLYQINSIVDSGNLASLSFMLPIGLYDRDKINGPVIIRMGSEGESYDGIGKERINVFGKITLADNVGPFGNPSSDSMRTAISLDTSEVIMVIFAPQYYSRENLKMHRNASQDFMLKYHPSGSTIFNKTLP
jgi:DNA/RNA-binding domain of Phe-tRNA-synthetase-like protein